jgi:hypothetical protein
MSKNFNKPLKARKLSTSRRERPMKMQRYLKLSKNLSALYAKSCRFSSKVAQNVEKEFAFYAKEN